MTTMTVGAWVYMLVVWTIITVVNVFCFYRVFRSKPDESESKKS